MSTTIFCDVGVQNFVSVTSREVSKEHGTRCVAPCWAHPEKTITTTCIQGMAPETVARDTLCFVESSAQIAGRESTFLACGGTALERSICISSRTWGIAV